MKIKDFLWMPVFNWFILLAGSDYKKFFSFFFIGYPEFFHPSSSCIGSLEEYFGYLGMHWFYFAVKKGKMENFLTRYLYRGDLYSRKYCINNFGTRVEANTSVKEWLFEWFMTIFKFSMLLLCFFKLVTFILFR